LNAGATNSVDDAEECSHHSVAEEALQRECVVKQLARIMMTLICAAFSICLVFAQHTPEEVPELHVNPTKVALGHDLASYYIGPWPYIDVKGLTPQQKEALAKAGGKGQIEMTNPDGKITTYSAHTYRSGSGDTYQIVSSTMPRKHVVAGAYTLVFIFAGQRSSAVMVTVTDIPALKQILATLHLEAAPGFPWCLARTHATLTVQNNTEQTVRFPRFDEMIGVAASVDIKTGAWKNRGFSDEWPRPPGWFTWNAAETEPTVTLKPGAKYEQTISLKELLYTYLGFYKHNSPVPPGQCEVTLHRPLDVLLGERHDVLADFFPVRLELNVITEFTFGTQVRK
jgi:hypothetical protein